MPILHWLTRENDLKTSGLASYRLLDHVAIYTDANTENMLIQGDNQYGLKALLPYYAGKVKCICIAQPYNIRGGSHCSDRKGVFVCITLCPHPQDGSLFRARARSTDKAITDMAAKAFPSPPYFYQYTGSLAVTRPGLPPGRA